MSPHLKHSQFRTLTGPVCCGYKLMVWSLSGWILSSVLMWEMCISQSNYSVLPLRVSTLPSLQSDSHLQVQGYDLFYCNHSGVRNAINCGCGLKIKTSLHQLMFHSELSAHTFSDTAVTHTPCCDAVKNRFTTDDAVAKEGDQHPPTHTHTHTDQCVSNQTEGG